MKVSFDFDFTLTNPKLKVLAIKFVGLGADVHITTSRLIETPKTKLPYDNREVYGMANKLGIDPKTHVHFTNGKEKAYFLKEFDLHFDDDSNETELVNQFCENCVGALIE